MHIGIYGTSHKTVPPKAHGGVQLINWITAEGLVERGHDVTLFARDGSKTNADLIMLPSGSGEVHEKMLAKLFEKNIKRCDVLIDTSTFSYPGRLYNDIPYLVRTGGDCNKRYCQYWTRNVVFPSKDHMLHHNAKDCACSKLRQSKGFTDTPILRKPVGYWLLSKDPKFFKQFKKPGTHYVCFGIIEPIKGTHYAIDFAMKARVPLIISGPIKDQN